MPKTHERRVAPKILKTQTLHYVEEIAGTTSAGVTAIPLEQIDLDNTQFEYRLDPDLAALVESIKKDGQQIPVILRGRKPPYQLICGFRRARSIKAIGGATVKAIILPDLDDEKAHRFPSWRTKNEEPDRPGPGQRLPRLQRRQNPGRDREDHGLLQPQVSRYLRLLTLPNRSLHP